ncbi:hypothetical protein AJ80_06155 [Polytolypa hystricis UAMH7299]|uniref:RNA-dependent RNA polymerase n=1 Tax=Polytolypa hystricis (strain UAMH7299) TaxID=1447883 RepID=A0A2B7XXE4_POLH7|nr:hypothetical protein AJ80_06155 [Polytolypa hystricis UAMH7299]
MHTQPNYLRHKSILGSVSPSSSSSPSISHPNPSSRASKNGRLPHHSSNPPGNVHLDEEQLAFEVISWSHPLHPANLNIQLLMILQHGGVHRDHLENLIEQEITQFYEELTDIVTHGSSVVCCWWLQMVGYNESATKRKTRRIDGFPASYIEQAIMLLEYGLLPLQLPYLTFLFDSFLKEHLGKLGGFKIWISQSTYAYCIADPYCILKEGEIYTLHFQRSGRNMGIMVRSWTKWMC